MPIVFQQPQPFNAAIAQGYGAAQAQQANNAVVDRALEGQNQMRFQAAQAQLARQQQMALANQENQTRQTIANYANLQHGLDQQAGIGQRQAEMEDARNQFASQLQFQAARDSFHAQQAQAQVAQQAEAQAWVHQQDLSFKEQLDLQRMKAAVTEINNDPTLDPQTKSDLILQVKTRVDPMEARLKQSQMRRMEESANLFAQQAQLKETVNQKNAALDAQTFESRMRTVPMPDGTNATFFQTGFDANARPTWQQIKQEAGGGAALQARQQESEMKHQEHYITLRMKIAEQAVKRATEEADPGAPDAVGHWTNKLLDQAGLGRTWDEQRAKLGLTAQRDGGGMLAGSPAPAPVPQSAGERIANPPEPLSQAKPFNAADRSTMSDVQQTMIGAFDASRVQWEGRTDLPPEVRQHGAMVLSAAKDLLAANGSYQRMPGPTKKLYDQYQAEYRQLLAQFPPPPPPAAPAPAAAPVRPVLSNAAMSRSGGF